MTFIRSISGFRGTIGGPEEDNLTPPDIVQGNAGLRELDSQHPEVQNRCGLKWSWAETPARPGDMVQRLVTGTLMGMGIDVIDLGLSTTPTVEMAVIGEGADGGIILTASHNPVQWNALKLLDAQGAFISAEAGAEVIRRSCPASLIRRGRGFGPGVCARWLDRRPHPGHFGPRIWSTGMPLPRLALRWRWMRSTAQVESPFLSCFAPWV